MKLAIAKQHEETIKEMTDNLNAAIAHATMEGLHIALDINEVNTIGVRSHPIVSPNVTVNPCSIE